MGVEPEEGYAEVKHVVLKYSVLQEEVNVVQMELNLGDPVAEVLHATNVELFCLGSFEHQYLVGRLDRKLVDKEPLLIWQHLTLFFVFNYVQPPLLLCYKLVFVDHIENNQSTRGATLDNTQNQD